MSHSFSKAMAIMTAAAMTLLPASPAFADGATATPIQHLVIIFQENVSFDHYF
jgi:phospholipase C